MRNAGPILFALAVLAVWAFSAKAWAGVSGRETAAALRDASDDLEALAGSEDAPAAKGEIEIARGWLEEGFDLLRKGRIREAAVMAQRLSTQLALVRSALALGKLRRELARVEAEAGELERRVEELRARHGRLVLERDGAHATLAYPRIGKAGGDE